MERLRKSSAFIPELSMVAKVDDKIIGYIMLTEIKIKNKQDEFISLALAPVAVLPEYQKMGIGGKMIKYAYNIARELGYKSVVVLGHEKYYPKFGYQQVAISE